MTPDPIRRNIEAITAAMDHAVGTSQPRTVHPVAARPAGTWDGPTAHQRAVALADAMQRRTAYRADQAARHMIGHSYHAGCPNCYAARWGEPTA